MGGGPGGGGGRGLNPRVVSNNKQNFCKQTLIADSFNLQQEHRQNGSSSLPPLLPPILSTNHRPIPVTIGVESRDHHGNYLRLPDIDSMDVQV